MTLRTLSRVCVALFVVSTLFPVTAGVINRGRPSLWLGIADVAVAAMLFFATAVLANRVRTGVSDRHRLDALRATQWVISLIPLLLVAFFLAGRRVDWTVVVIGIAWRSWLLIYSLPFLAAGLDDGRRRP